MKGENIKPHGKKKLKISTKRVIISTIAVVLSLCTLTVGMLVAKYLNERSADGLVRANHFYFTSNLLDGEEHILAPNSKDSTDGTSVTFTLGNHEDDLRYSEVDISYEVTVDNGAEVTSGGSGTLVKGDINDAEVTISNLQTGTYHIKAVGKGGYTKTLTATIVVPEKETKIYYHIDDSADEYTLLTVWNEGDKEGSVTIKYKGIPDNTNPDMTTWLKDEEHSALIEPHESKVYRFFDATEIIVTGATEEKEPY